MSIDLLLGKMSEGIETLIYGRSRSSTVQPGDVDPAQFDFNTKLNNHQKLNLLLKNEVIQLACDNAVQEAIRQGVEWDKDQVIKGKKHGVDHKFKATDNKDKNTGERIKKQAFNNYLEWIGFWIKCHEGLQWSRCFGTSIAVFWDENAGKENHVTPKNATLGNGLYFGPNDNPQAYLDFDCYYPTTKGNGFDVFELDDDQKPLIYKLTIFVTGMEKSKTTYIHRDRVVVLAGPRKEIKWGGSSRIEGLDRYAVAGDQMLKALVSRAKKVAGGILTGKGLTSQAEWDAFDNYCGKDLTYLDRIGLGPDKDLEWVTPELKVSGEYSSLFDILWTTYARHLRYSKEVMDGEPQGVKASAKYDVGTTYTEFYRIQSHYKRNIEEMVFKLGKTETSFEWNAIIPEMEENDFNIGINEPGGKGENEPEGEEKKESESNEKTTEES